VSWTVGLIAALVAGAAPTPEPVDLRVMTFNVRYGTANDGPNHWDQRKEFLADVVRKFDPDLLGTQETLSFQRDFLAIRFSGLAPFGAGRDDGKDRGEMAAVYYRADRFEKLDGGHFWLSQTPDVAGAKGWDAALPRIATWVKLMDKKAPGKPVLFLNTHFDHKGVTARVESGKLIRTRLAALGADCSVIVTGDFNAGDGSAAYQALFGKERDRTSPLVDAYRVAHPKPVAEEGTFNGFAPTATKGDRIDWVGVSRDWVVKRSEIDRTARDGRVPSDHFPVTAVLRR
jgi:endonuclease/exonuclease/phosphatase family metal-dependent hydrolase